MRYQGVSSFLVEFLRMSVFKSEFVARDFDNGALQTQADA